MNKTSPQPGKSMAVRGARISFGIGQIFQHADNEVGISSIAILFVIEPSILLSIRKEIPIVKHIRNNPLL